jgi:hypothetical protein
MFSGSIVWKGFVYSLLMMVAKLLVSLVIYFEYFTRVWSSRRKTARQKKTPPIREQQLGSPAMNLPALSEPPRESEEAGPISRPPHSVALLVGSAMVARGEIGFLIASLSRSSGTLALRHSDGTTTESSGEQIFLVLVWAVVLCTIAGPIGVGILVRQLRQGNLHDNWL